MEPYYESSKNFSLIDRLLRRIENRNSSDRLLLRLAFFAIVGSFIWLLFLLNNNYSVMTPIRGGVIIEGIVGTPRFVNPALATTRADQDVTALIYSGLVKIMPDGSLQNDIAENITVSDDGLIYNITLRRDVRFHDNTPLTARDVIYTLQLIKNPDLKSPLRGNWSNVTIEEIGEYELNIILEEAYAPFIENFTLGIMPAHAWSNLPVEQLPFSQLNTEPIGSGPFSVASAKRDTSGIIQHYTLKAFQENNYDVKINQLELMFFQNEAQLLTSLKAGNVTATAYLTFEQIKEITNNKQFTLIEEPLPRTFAIFFNQNRSVALRSKSVRQALTAVINRNEIIDNALLGFGVPIDTTIHFSPSELQSPEVTLENLNEDLVKSASAILETDGWKKNDLGYWEKEIDKEPVTLTITIKTSNTPIFEAILETVAKQWKALGVNVITEQFEQYGFVQSVIRPRDFEALLFGIDMSRSFELYPFWHSSQQDDPGLNIAQYANIEVDSILEKTRSEQSESIRNNLLQEANTIITEEYPAIFLFQPNFTYVMKSNMSVPEMNKISKPADRFNNVTKWHTEKDSLWSNFHDDI